MRMTRSRVSICRMRRSVSIPLMPPMRISMSTRSGLSLGMSFSPSSPLDAVDSSISGESKMRRNEYCTSASSSINSSLFMGCQNQQERSIAERRGEDREFVAFSVQDRRAEQEQKVISPQERRQRILRSEEHTSELQ